MKENEEDDRSAFREDNKIFRFEARWIHHVDFKACIKNIWGLSKAKNRGQWCQVVEECGSQLKQWHRDVYSASQHRMGWLVRRLKVVRKMAPSPSVLEEYRRVEQELRLLRRQEETGAWQRCRPFVLRDGDKNTAYFHSKAAMRRKRNHIKMLEDSEGLKHRSREGCIKW